MSKLAHSNQEFMDELDRLRFEEDGPMYAEWGDFDLPEQNERAREIVRKMEGESK